MRKPTETRLVDRMIGAYVDWREACRLVHDANRSWASATGPRARVAFWRYTAALDAEERAAEVYARLVLRAGQLATDAPLLPHQLKRLAHSVAVNDRAGNDREVLADAQGALLT